MKVYYNDNERYCVAWLKELIKAGHLPPGDVDDRDIRLVQPGDLKGYDQAHFFAGIGGWPLALRWTEWGDRPVWTGSCPCQPFSAAGKRAGFKDPRHLWPEWCRLITECRPATILGEQVARAGAWLDTVFTDLEGLDYACGAAVIPACAVGAPHIRERIWFVANSHAQRCGWGPNHQGEAATERDRSTATSPEKPLADADRERCRLQWQPEHTELESPQWDLPYGRGTCGWGTWETVADPSGSRCDHGESGEGGPLWDETWGPQPERRGDAMADSTRLSGEWGGECPGGESQSTDGGANVANAGIEGLPLSERQTLLGSRRGQEGGTVTERDWWRSEPAICRVAHGVQQRVSKLRSLGNAIVPQVAAQFIRAVLNV